MKLLFHSDEKGLYVGVLKPDPSKYLLDDSECYSDYAVRRFHQGHWCFRELSVYLVPFDDVFDLYGDDEPLAVLAGIEDHGRKEDDKYFREVFERMIEEAKEGKHIVELYRHTRFEHGVSVLVAVLCKIDGVRRTVPAWKWRELEADPANTVILTDEEMTE